MRSYLIIILLIGITASMLGHLPHKLANSANPSSPTRVVVLRVPTAGQPNRGQTVDPLNRSIELTRDENGYFFADVQINGAPVHMLVDTGATVIALSREDARMAGIATSIGMNDVVGEGADGVVKGEEVTIDRVTLGDKTVEGVQGIVLSNGGQSLLGQSFLTKFASVKIEGDKMVLR